MIDLVESCILSLPITRFFHACYAFNLFPSVDAVAAIHLLSIFVSGGGNTSVTFGTWSDGVRWSTVSSARHVDGPP